MNLPNQAKPVDRKPVRESRGAVAPGEVRPADWLDDILKSVQVIGGTAAQVLPHVLPYVL